MTILKIPCQSGGSQWMDLPLAARPHPSHSQLSSRLRFVPCWLWPSCPRIWCDLWQEALRLGPWRKSPGRFWIELMAGENQPSSWFPEGTLCECFWLFLYINQGFVNGNPLPWSRDQNVVQYSKVIKTMGGHGDPSPKILGLAQDIDAAAAPRTMSAWPLAWWFSARIALTSDNEGTCQYLNYFSCNYGHKWVPFLFPCCFPVDGLSVTNLIAEPLAMLQKWVEHCIHTSTRAGAVGIPPPENEKNHRWSWDIHNVFTRWGS